MTQTTYQYSDGGRAAAGYKGDAKDCVCRAIAIVTGRPYADVYAAITSIAGRSPRQGIRKADTRRIMEHFGGRWTATMTVGAGCTVHLTADELPGGRIVASVSRHVVAMIDGVIYDNHDPRRAGRRCVYGYWQF